VSVVHVGRAVGSAPEPIAEDDGELVAPGEVQAMAGSLVRLAMDPARAARMGAAGRRDAQARFGIEAMVASYQRLYESRLRAGTATRGH
jgi:glycosyltransferase involved in cell wall biosynthesis